MRDIVVIAHDIRSTHNVGSLLRTAEGLGVTKVYLTGYTPYPIAPYDNRLPHIAFKLDAAIRKTALGAEKLIKWEHQEDVAIVIAQLIEDGYTIYGLEQTLEAIELPKLAAEDKSALLLGSEVTGITTELLDMCKAHVVIPMFGKKESFNVVQAAAMALYALRFSK